MSFEYIPYQICCSLMLLSRYSMALILWRQAISETAMRMLHICRAYVYVLEATRDLHFHISLITQTFIPFILLQEGVGNVMEKTSLLPTISEFSLC